ncbi:MAG: FKBP-type peptidyl-prolyl cis-trans isomerase [Sodaliphilus sp.]|jgi:FKBP-type peptidyl-prolyl cis-trans isomerase FklB|nr:FKBP-type peptidyl-prolyl cis-trans isomerase [Bacteroidales bacterium]MDY2592568.1 FKBP-type peptidyl-prolyl cis-trans isomerase [Sodaliphilus sp.]MCI6146787.1 FKBP-type peptidyl-prolyl cis-trans isomerase [Bacteroidales bacterium]MCI6225071.1 FKBP-type peptidyl-prolyl cis-trans isomerase [Bacteroidales bacterium]MCI6293086.1 FKBP-type peptidyl-prolyl cis-trans isomerase [Bacteroidales bacterium]
MDKLSYALGLSMGQNFKGSGVDKLNADDFADALRAVYGEGTPAMTYDEAKQVVQEYFTNLQAKAGEMNAKAGKEYLANNAKEEGVKVTESGLQYLVVKEGNGKKPGPNDVVTVHYTGRLIDGTVFDSSVERGEPATFAVGQVIPGWVEGLQLMSEGSAYRLFIPSELAYGEHGTGPIQPNSTLIFDVQLLKVGK